MSGASLFEGIDTVIVRVRDLEASRRWYEERLGLVARHEDAASGVVVLDCGGSASLTLFALGPGEAAPPAPAACWPIFRVRDAERARAELASRGVQVERLMSDGSATWFDFADAEGNRLEACQILGAGWA